MGTGGFLGGLGSLGIAGPTGNLLQNPTRGLGSLGNLRSLGIGGPTCNQLAKPDPTLIDLIRPYLTLKPPKARDLT